MRNKDVRRSLSSWRALERRAIRPEWWCAAFAVVGMLVVDVWQSSRMAEVCLSLDQSRSALVQAQARLEFERARLDRETTRAELAPVASQLGLIPANALQVVHLPAAYLADAREERPRSDAPGLVAWAEKASRVLVPEATARQRDRN